MPTDHFAAASDGQAPFDYAGLIQTPEGLFYPHTIPSLFYVYDQGQFVAMGSATAAMPTTPAGVPVVPFVSPNWYMSPRPMPPPPPWVNMRPPQAGGANAPSSSSSPDQGAGSVVGGPPTSDAHGQNPKAA